MEEWSNMPQDIVNLILPKLSVKDQRTFSQVCRSWNEAVLASPYRHSPICLMYNQKSNPRLWRFLHRNTSFSKRFPIPKNATIRFSNYGWLLMMSRDSGDIFFFDPFNNRTIEPPNPPRNRSYSTLCFFHPPTSPECFIVGIKSVLEYPRNLVDIGLLRHGDDKWTSYRYVTKEFDVSLAPPVLHRGLVYFVDVRGNIATFDINLHGQTRHAWSVSNRCVRQRRFRKNIQEHFLIKPKDEDAIYAVFGLMREERDVKVFRLVESNDKHWEAVANLGKKVFYVSNTSSIGYSTRDKSMANKIFFPKLRGDKFVFYCLDTEKYHSVDGSYSSNDSHGLKRLDFATWTMPTQQVDGTAKLISSSFRSVLLRWFRRVFFYFI